MSETKSIEERYERIRGELERDGCFRAIYLLDDLMAERGKMKDDISLLKRLLVQEIKETQVTDARFIEP